MAYATLGMGAIGTVLYGVYAASEGDKKKRSSLYKRSLHEEKQKAADLLWASLSKHLVQGKGKYLDVTFFSAPPFLCQFPLSWKFLYFWKEDNKCWAFHHNLLKS